MLNIDILNYINWLRSVNCGIALIDPSKIDWLKTSETKDIWNKS